MPCSLYNNNGFSCGCCEHFYKTNSVTLVGGVLVLNITVPTTHIINNREKFCICVVQAIPAGVTSVTNVAITINGSATQYPLINRCGNRVKGDQIRTRKLYHTYIATDTLNFLISNCELRKTGFNYPTITPVA